MKKSIISQHFSIWCEYGVRKSVIKVQVCNNIIKALPEAGDFDLPFLQDDPRIYSDSQWQIVKAKPEAMKVKSYICLNNPTVSLEP